MPADLPLVVDVEASALEGGYPIEVGIADVGAGTVHAWLVRPHASWAWDAWNPASAKIHGLTKADLDRGDDVLTVAQGVLRVVGGRKLASDNPEFDGFWLGRLFEAEREDTPNIKRKSLAGTAAELAHRYGRSSASIDALNRARNAAVDHSAAGDAASWAAAIELIVGREEIDLQRIDEVFEKWISRAQAASPWRAGPYTLSEKGVQA